MGVFFGFLLLLVGLGVASPLILQGIRRTLRQHLEALSPQLELTDVAWEEQWLGLTLVGRKEDTPVALVSRPWGSFEVRAGIDASLPFGLSLTPQNRDVRLEGLQDIQVGVPDLDAAFQVQCENPAAAIRYMRDERTQQALRAALEADPKASVFGGEVRLSLPRSSNKELLRRQVRAAIRSAQGLREATGLLPAKSPPVLEGPEAPRSPTSVAPASTAPALSVPEPRFSAEYVHRMRLKYQQRRVMQWGMYGVMAAIILLPGARLFSLLGGPLASVADFLLEWDAVAFIAIMACILLRLALDRCPSCSTTLPQFEPKVSDLPHLFRRRRVKCESCGIQLR